MDSYYKKTEENMINQAHELQLEAGPSSAPKKPKKFKKKTMFRTAGGEVWDDPTLLEWDEHDFRIFCGDLGNEVTNDLLARAFSRYPSFLKAKVIRDKKTNKSRGFGFVSFKDHNDFKNAMREMNGKYIGNRPIKLCKSNWDSRTVDPKSLAKPSSGKLKTLARRRM